MLKMPDLTTLKNPSKKIMDLHPVANNLFFLVHRSISSKIFMKISSVVFLREVANRQTKKRTKKDRHGRQTNAV